MLGFDPNWYLIYTRFKREATVSRQLALHKIHNYCPVVKQVRQWHDRKKTIQTPLFPSYVFLNITDVKQFYDVLSIDGVVRFVKFENKNAIIPLNVINSIKALVDNIQSISVEQRRFSKGQSLQIKEGPLKGLDCKVVQEKASQCKVVVSVEALHMSIVAEVPAHALQANNQAVV